MFKLVVLSVVLAVAAAKPSALGLAGLAPWGGIGLGAYHGAALGTAIAAPWAAPLAAAPLAHGAPGVAVAAPLLGAAYNYRGPLSLAPGQPANIVAHDGRPLDTLSVNVDRALHYTARAVDHANGAHILGKRSINALYGAGLHGAGLGLGHAALAVPAVAPAWGAAALRAPVAPLGVGHLGAVGPWGARLGAWGHAGIW